MTVLEQRERQSWGGGAEGHRAWPHLPLGALLVGCESEESPALGSVPRTELCCVPGGEDPADPEADVSGPRRAPSVQENPSPIQVGEEASRAPPAPKSWIFNISFVFLIYLCSQELL